MFLCNEDFLKNAMLDAYNVLVCSSFQDRDTVVERQPNEMV